MAAVALAGCGSVPPVPAESAVSEVRDAETGFARSMADRDFDAFAAFIAEDAVFVNGGDVLRGKPAILSAWRKFFEPAEAPFSWAPEIVEVTLQGDLGYTEGPVAAPTGQVFSRFYSTWRREASGRWRVVFDNGYRVCDCAK